MVSDRPGPARERRPTAYGRRDLTAYRREVASRLPPSSTRRLSRFDNGNVATSLLSAGGAAALAAVGLEPVGDVMGCTVALLSDRDIGLCSRRRTSSPVKLGGARWEPWSVSYTRQVSDAYQRVIDRLLAEATHMGADGVVDVRLTSSRYEEAEELFAIGTAVRARSRTRPTRPFCTDLAGSDVAKLLLRGWVPVGLHAAVEIGIRHNDLDTLTQANQRGANRYTNTEVDGFTEVTQKVMDSATRKFGARIRAAGADGGLLTSFDTQTWHRTCLTQMHSSDHIVRTLLTGTSVARYARRTVQPINGLSIMPVHPFPPGGTR